MFTLLSVINFLTKNFNKIFLFAGDNESDTPAEVVEGDVTVAKSERSHLVVWQVGLQSMPKPTSQF